MRPQNFTDCANDIIHKGDYIAIGSMSKLTLAKVTNIKLVLNNKTSELDPYKSTISYKGFTGYGSSISTYKFLNQNDQVLKIHNIENYKNFENYEELLKIKVK